MTAALAATFCFFRMHHGHGHLNLIWCFWIPLSFVAMERWTARPTWTRLAIWTAVIVLQALAAWYEAVLITVADVLFLVWLFAVEGRRMPLSRFVLQGLAAVAVAFALVWPFARHYFILHSESPAFSAAASADLAGWFVPPENTWMGQWLLAHHVKGPRWIWGEVTVYLGWITVGLATARSGDRSSEPRSARAPQPILHRAHHHRRRARPGSVRERSGVRIIWLVTVRHARAPAGTEPLQNSRALHGADEAGAGRPRGDRVRGDASPIRHGRTRGDDRLTLAPARRVLRGHFPGGEPQPFPVPPVYKYIATLSPGAVAVAAGLRETDRSGSWKPTTRTSPPRTGTRSSTATRANFRRTFVDLSERMKRFPDPCRGGTMRDVGVKYVVLHAGQRGAATTCWRRRRRAADFRLLARFDRDYLFEVVPADRAVAGKERGPVEPTGTPTPPTLTVIVPCYNEAEVVERFCDELVHVLERPTSRGGSASSTTAAPTRRWSG